jgi:outer membrane protein assembly factor BamA
VGFQAERRWLLPGEDLDDAFNLGLRPKVERIRISDIGSEAPPNAWFIEGGNTVHAVTLSWLWRRIDQEHATERGFRLLVESEYSGGVLGGDFDYWKNQGEASRVWTLFRDADERAHTLKARVGGGVAMSLEGGVDVPLVERLFAGGAGGIGAVRGYSYAGLGPHGEGNPFTNPGQVRRSIEANHGEPMGGDAMAVASLEYGFPIVDEFLRGAAFADAGNCGFSTGDLKRDWRLAAGFGILIKVQPLFGAVPLRFDFGWTILDVDGDDEQVLSFEFQRFF